MGRVWIYAVSTAALLVAVALAAIGFAEEPGALSNWQALVLGITQGLTELLPISSSGHLILVPWLADWDFLQQNEAFNHTFDVALHVGTLVAVVGYFWPEFVGLARGLVRSAVRLRVETTDERLAWLIVIATIPAAVAGALGEGVVIDHLGEPWQIAILLPVFAILLYIADRRPQRRNLGSLRTRDAVAVGLAQALSLMPGVSRSGVTITASRFLGLDRDAAARFSFLLLIPTTMGAIVWKGLGDVLLGDLPKGWEGPFIVGMLAALGSGLLAIHALLGYVRRHDYTVFVVYRLVVALVILLLVLSGAYDASF